MNYKRKGNFDFLKLYTYFVPTFPEIIILMVWLVVGILAGNAVGLLFSKAFGYAANSEMTMLLSYPIMFVPPMIYASCKSRRNGYKRAGILVDSSSFAPVGGVGCAVLASLGTVALSYCADGITGLLPAMPEFLKNLLESMVSGKLWVNILCVSIFAPVFEEWLCRGMVLRGLLGNNVKPVWSIIISAMIFAFIHMNPWQAIPAFMLGCLFGYVYYRTGSLKLTMLMHCVNNSLALTVSHIPSMKDYETWRDMLEGPEYFVVLAACILMVIVVVKIMGKIPVSGNRGNMEKVPSLFES